MMENPPKRGREADNGDGDQRAPAIRPRTHDTTATAAAEVETAVVEVEGVAGVSPEQLQQGKSEKGRLCGDLTKLILHKKSLKPTHHELQCAICGKPCYTKCGLCNMSCHDNPTRGAYKGYQCFLELHNDVKFGLARVDAPLVNKRKRDWAPPTEEEKEKNARHIQNILKPVVPKKRRPGRPRKKENANNDGDVVVAGGCVATRVSPNIQQATIPIQNIQQQGVPNARRGTDGGDGKKRTYSRPRKDKTANEDSAVVVGGAATKVLPEQLQEGQSVEGRLCGDLTKLILHKKSLKATHHELQCAFCGKPCYTKCGLCNMNCHENPSRGAYKGYQCFIELHNTARFGLARVDARLVNRKKDNWTPPTEKEKEDNSQHIKNIQQELPCTLQDVKKRRPGRPRKNETVNKDRAAMVVGGVARVSPGQLQEGQGTNGRLCGDLTKLMFHSNSMIMKHHELPCAFCGKPCYSRCTICKLACHDGPAKGSCRGYQCFLELHSDAQFGQAKVDTPLVDKEERDWVPPTEEETTTNLNMLHPTVP